jgi:hypothetical protein
MKVHADAAAAASADAVGAAAYTVGRHVVFAAGAFQPATKPGQDLLAHELSHAVQQGMRDPTQAELKLLPSHDAAERSAAPGGPDAQIGGGQRELAVARQGLQTPPAPTPPAPVLPSAEELTRRIALAIGIWETNRGGTAPRPRESGLQTTAGVPASMATIEQATMPYMVDALRQHAELRALATPPLTDAEIAAAQQRINAVDGLLSSVNAASAAGTTPDAFIQANAAQMTAAGMQDADVRTMFSAVTLRGTVTAAHGRVQAAADQAVAEARAANPAIRPTEVSRIRQTTTTQQATQEAGAIPAAQRLGISAGSLATYIRSPATWGENRAAWERLAVQRMPDSVGTRIQSVATAQQGTAVAGAVIRGRVDTALARTPTLTEEQLVTTVATQNNPRETNYGANVWSIYQRLPPPQPPAQTPTPASANP